MVDALSRRAMKVLALIGAGVAAAFMLAAFWLYTPDIRRATLDAKYRVAPDDNVALADIRVHLLDEGPRQASVVILLHGFGSSLLTFDAWAAILSSDHRVIRYDLPGFGLTGPDPTGSYSEERGLTVLAALMDRLGVARASLIGNSMGGKLAWQFAAAHPDRVDKLVLISPDGFASPGFEYGKAPTVPLAVKILPYILPKAMLRQTLVAAFADPARLTPEVVERYWDMVVAPGVRDAMLARMGQTVLHDPAPRLRTIRAPTLILWGEQDAMIPVANAADYKREIANSTVLILPGLGHVPHEEAPEVSLAPVKAFLAADPVVFGARAP